MGTRKSYSLCGSMGSQFMIDEWGHDMLCLDYRLCGPTGKPRVVHVDQAFDYAITLVAETFERFVLGLYNPRMRLNRRSAASTACGDPHELTNP